MSEVRQHMGWTARVGYWWIVIALLIGATVSGVYLAKPVWLGFERRAFVASPQYVEARRTELLQLAGEVRGIDVKIAAADNSSTREALRLQRDALVARMRESIALIPADAVPSEVHRVMR